MGKWKKIYLFKRLVVEITANHFLDIFVWISHKPPYPSHLYELFIDWLFVKDFIHIDKVIGIRQALVYTVMNVLVIRR
jgi:hypothetical protein